MLVAIDGTDSKGWSDEEKKASHVRRIHEAYRGRKLDHIEGPRWDGIDAGGIASRAMRELLRMLGKENARRSFRRSGDPAPSYLLRSARHESAGTIVEEPVDLVGFSRGAAICVVIAWRLQALSIPVRFLGLFDAVDRSTSIGAGFDFETLAIQDTAVIPGNVQYAVHAMRDPDRQSRNPFGNTATKAKGL